MKCKFIICVVFCFATLLLKATTLRFNHFSVNDGLSQGNVTAIGSDYLGLIWMGTWDGLNVYNGFQNVVYRERANDRKSLKGTLVNSLFETKQKVMYVATSTCLNEFHRKHESFSSYSISSKPQDYYILSEEDNYLILSIDLELWTFDLQSKKFKKIQNPISSQWNNYFKTTKHAVNHSEFLYANLYHIMNKFSDRFLKLSSFFGNHILNDIVDLNNIFYLATDQGLYYSSNLLAEPISISDSIKIKCLAIHEDVLLVGSQTKGLLVYDVHHQKCRFANTYNERNKFSISGDFVRTLFVDQHKTLWISTLGNGICYTTLKPQLARTILTSYDSLLLQSKDCYIKNIAEDDQQQLWIGTVTGNIYILDKNYEILRKLTPKDIDRNLKPNSYQQIIFDSKRGMYLLSEQGLFKMIEPYRFKRILSYNLSYDQMYLNGMALLNDSTYLLSTRDGLSLYNWKRESITQVDGIGRARVILSNYTDTKGYTYINPMFAGIEIYKMQHGKLKFVKSFPIGCNIKYYYEQKDTLWMATTKGILKMNTTNFSYLFIDESNGIPNQYVYCLLKDYANSSTFWLSSNKGIFSYNTVSQKVNSLGLNDGLTSLEYNTNSFLKRRNGDMVFGSTDGLTILNSNKSLTSPSISEVKLIRFKVLGADDNFCFDSINRVYKIPYSKNGFSASLMRISFPGIKSSIPYQLVGFDKTELENTNPAELRYSNLPIGRYYLRTESTDHLGQKCWRNLAIIDVVAPWYLSIWAFLAYLALFSYLIYWIVNLYLRKKLQEREAEEIKQSLLLKERDRISADLHDDIGSTLSSVSIYNELIMANIYSKPDAIPKLSEQISRQTRELMLRTEDIIWSLKLSGQQHETIAKRIREYVAEFLEEQQIQSLIHIEDRAEQLLQQPEIRRSILMIVKEAMNNCRKYSSASTFELDIRIQKNNFVVRMKDDGIGFNSSQIIYGDGIGNIKKRCANMQGELIITSSPGHGTEIICMIPIATFR